MIFIAKGNTLTNRNILNIYSFAGRRVALAQDKIPGNTTFFRAMARSFSSGNSATT